MSRSLPPSTSELYRDSYIVVLLDADGVVTRLVRSATPYPDIPSLMRSFEAVIAVLERLKRGGRVLLFDVRAPMGRNDPEFEKAMTPLRARIDRYFVRIGVLVRSAAGALQIRRLISEDGVERIVGTQESEVEEALKAGLPSRRS